ncbi:bile acid:sodium symporter family protein [Endozoicomonas arenosclerae]|uniref:bile acid:sodium symporter family protein n=1 Tax=Endozoicomonas arenosclerae TaxID=1633495 RepID=UPI000A5FAC8E|nr:bile acid:sodium symporter family protein [Endozoicomonas arenosclerae]
MLLTTITRLFPLWAVLFSALAYSFPGGFDHLGYLIAPGLSLIMLFMGLTLSWEDFAQIRNRLPALTAGVFLQFGIMPFAGLLIAQLLELPVDLTVGMILAGSVAGGTASNVLCYLAKGDVALSISMTAASTLIGAFATPFLISFLAHQYIEVDPWDLMWGLAKIVLFPVALGVLINHFCHGFVKKLNPVFPLCSMATIILVIAVVVASNAQALPEIGLITILAVALHNCTGLSLGYLVAHLLGFDKKTCKTVAIEVGMQNSGLAVVLATKFFTPGAALPATFFSIWHNITGSALATWWARNASTQTGEQET